MSRRSATDEALIIVDVQRDFLPGGALGVPDGDAIFDPLFSFAAQPIEYVALTRDWHPANHISFSDQPLFQDKSWPEHCVQNTPGAEILPGISTRFPEAPVFSKGFNAGFEAYSGFDGVAETDDGSISLLQWLDDRNVRYLYVCGLATDYCVKETVLDARSYDFSTVVLAEATRGVSYATTVRAVQEMVEAGATIA